jgi:hypothetical protein
MFALAGQQTWVAFSADREASELPPGTDAELSKDVAQVVFDCLLADIELRRYLTIGHPLRHQGHDVVLPVRERER